MVTDLALLRLLQLVSPGLPIGMYSYSQGLECAIEDGWLKSADEVAAWLSGLLSNTMAYVDLPILARLYDAWVDGNELQINHWSQQLIANRETAELRAEDRLSGQALARLLSDLGLSDMHVWQRQPTATLATIFAFAAVHWHIPKYETMLGYLWSWLENQCLCAVKLVPLGQVAGQRLLIKLADNLPERVNDALSLPDSALGGSAFAMVLASSRHEMQYSRLFRS